MLFPIEEEVYLIMTFPSPPSPLGKSHDTIQLFPPHRSGVGGSKADRSPRSRMKFRVKKPNIGSFTQKIKNKLRKGEKQNAYRYKHSHHKKPY